MRDLFKQVPGDGSYDLGDILVNVIAGAWHLWALDDDGKYRSVVLTQIVEFPHNRKMIVSHMVGDLEAVRLGIPDMYNHARQNGCTLIEVYGRQGWGRVLGEGWKLRACYQKDLRNA